MSDQRNRNTAIFFIGVAVAMLGLSFAAVPLYKLFCAKTGFAGTPQIGIIAGTRIEKGRVIRVQFNADVHNDLPWKFKPLQHEISINPGQMGLAFYEVQNVSNHPITGMASYNVTPDKAAIYFNKVSCFCFEEQKISPGDPISMPIQFFIDPDIVKDPDLKDLKVITLSYTFFKYKKGMTIPGFGKL